ncbi:hypothetical protein [uncultured Alsobacter sp.]|uniref:hypothetical protein n=1 Tax=uncultured Alsobacter sp. TaxID=1748258 RepID=UPI0025ECB4EA|nr:hypothetical protein [uncultured Alsobacter sp.]
MLRLATILWSLIGTTLAGTFVLGVLAIPALSDQGMRLIPWAVAAGFAIAVPVAVAIARGLVGGPHRIA